MLLCFTWFLKWGKMCAHDTTSKHYPRTCSKCDHDALYQKAVLPRFFFTSLASPTAVNVHCVTSERTTWAHICINILLQCNTDLTKLQLYSFYLKRQINLSECQLCLAFYHCLMLIFLIFFWFVCKYILQAFVFNFCVHVVPRGSDHHYLMTIAIITI